jgi:hypothetical protein
MTTLRAGSLPFAFLLAMAADANASAIPAATDMKDNLEPGMLSDLLRQSAAPEFTVKSVDLVKDSETTTVVQYFPNFPNFRNCFTGYWRNC